MAASSPSSRSPRPDDLAPSRCRHGYRPAERIALRSRLMCSALLLGLDLAQLLQALAFHRLAPLVAHGRRLLEVLATFPFADDPFLLDDPLESLQRLLDCSSSSPTCTNAMALPPSRAAGTAPGNSAVLHDSARRDPVKPGITFTFHLPPSSAAQVEDNHPQPAFAVRVNRLQRYTTSTVSPGPNSPARGPAPQYERRAIGRRRHPATACSARRHGRTGSPPTPRVRAS